MQMHLKKVQACIPRAGGDDPSVKTNAQTIEQYSPRRWG